MKITAVVAMDISRGIGIGNRLPWDIPQDMEHFKNTTKNGIMVMGGNTWRSLPKRPLPGRISIVISRSDNPDPHHEQVFFVKTPETAIELAKKLSTATEKNIFVIGGAQVFESIGEHLTHAVVTLIHYRTGADVFLPKLPGMWSRNPAFTRTTETEEGLVEFIYLTRERSCHH